MFLFQVAAVVCATFLVAWTPYATVSLISALVPKDEQKADGTLQAVMEAAASNSPSAAAGTLDVPSLLNWTYLEFYRKTYHSPENKWRQANNMSSASVDNKAELMTQGLQAFSSLPPVVTLIPAMFAKSHCMINPLIYQIMNREFRDAVYEMVFGQEMAERKRTRGRKESLFESKERDGTDLTGRKCLKTVTVKHKCFFFFSFRERQPQLLPELEEKEEQLHICVRGNHTFTPEETEEAVLWRGNRLLVPQQASGLGQTGH